MYRIIKLEEGFNFKEQFELRGALRNVHSFAQSPMPRLFGRVLR